MKRASLLKNRSEVELAMTPMIDVVFLLLIFFLATASFERIEQSMATGISEAPEKISQQAAGLDDWTKELTESGEDVVIKIEEAQGNVVYRFNDLQLANKQEIATRLQALIAARADIPIIVDPQETVAMGVAIEVYDIAKGAGAIEVFFATRL
jgi:biopolymer transport protein ExbD